jgi:hypothetical protein
VPVDIWGDSPLAEATVFGARSLGWDVTTGADVIAVAPLASTVAECDALIARPTAGKRAFAWPTVSVTAVQQMIARCHSVGPLTNLSSRSTRPQSSLLTAAHDQVALLLLVAQINGHGAPTEVSLRSTAERVDQLVMRFEGFAAAVEVTWDNAVTPSLDVQVAGTDGVLRIETDPSTQLEQNGALVPLPRPAAIAPELQPLRDTGIINMLQTIGAAFHDDRPLAHAFSFEFGRSVVAIIEAAETGAGVFRPTQRPR